MKIVSSVLIGLIFLIIGASSAYYYFEKYLPSRENGGATQSANDDSFQSFTNKSLNFFLKYPATWLKEEPKTLESSDTLFSINFFDPVRSKELEISDCLINESFNWTNTTPVKEDCTQILADATQEQRESLNTKIYPRNIYVTVVQPKTVVSDLSVWIKDKFKNSDGSQYSEPLENVTVSGLPSYAVSVGCCANYDVAYIVQKGELIYEIGTNYGDGQIQNGRNSLLDETIKSFRLN